MATDGPLTYTEVRRALRTRSLRHAFLQGNGGPLTFFWVLGAGVLLTVVQAPILASIYSLACLALAVPAVRETFVDAAVRATLTRQLIEERYRVTEINLEQLRTEVTRGIGALTEMASKIHQAERAGRPGSGLEGVFADAAGLFDLQVQSARQAQDLTRVLRLVRRDDDGEGERATRSGGSTSPAGDDAQLRLRNIEAVEQEAAAAAELVTSIGQKLETMLLVAFQIDKEAIDLVRVEEAKRESSEAIARLNDVVTARRRAAARLITGLSVDDERSLERT